ncbi:MAG: hydroxyacylglutathione hydrolase [Sedimentisphaerales bacterium]|nr:hydroxyacylglutathione hydrolase [Sedimentisphaerales bacterium]
MSAESLTNISAAVVILTCGDNYVYVCRYEERNAFVVDPSESGIVSRALAERKLQLTTALVTHHHGDHTGGIGQLKRQTGCKVVGADRVRVASCDRCVSEGNVLTLGHLRVTVLATPGHTRTSVCYYLAPPAAGQPGAVWTGDTLFIGGCGRPMECDASVLWESLTKLAELPDDTLVYCGHDYTAENYEFALTIEPDNEAVRRRLAEVKRAGTEGRPTVPSTIAQEKATNIFLRSSEPAVQRALDMNGAAADQVFAELRRRKNRFG